MKRFMESSLRDDGFSLRTSSLKFSTRNQKLGDITTISLPAGHSCPFAKDCRSCTTLKNTPNGFGIQDGPHTKFRCYTAIDETLRPAVRKARWHNFLLLLAACRQSKSAVIKLIESSIPVEKWGKPTRLHVAGDFFNQIYFDAWLEVARRHPTRLFYAYTKALPLWVKRLDNIPSNLRLTASVGGTHDWMIEKYKLRYAKVVESLKEAKDLGLPIDHDDSHAYGTGGNFALLVHGQQPKGSNIAKTWRKLIKMGLGGYGKQKQGMAGVGPKSLSGGYFS